MSKTIKAIVLSATMPIVLAYSAQFLWGGMHKGQSDDDFAWEILAHETLSRQYDGVPQMRIAGAGAPPTVCDQWNFEGFWGRCVSIGLDVRDYKPDYHPIVEREVMQLASQLRKPCTLVPALGFPNESDLMRKLGCNSSHKTFKLRIWVNSVTVAVDAGPPTRPNRWSPKTSEDLISYQFTGTF